MTQNDERQGWLRPGQALLHPAWLTAVALLVLNDHLLKGSVWAGVLTGKLSDFAGLFLAPVLVAALLRRRRPGGVIACAVAVGVVFAAINLWPAAALAWDALWRALGWGWHTTVDPTDLMALPMVPLSLWFFWPAMQAPAGAPWRAWGRGLATAVGGLACMATPSEEIPDKRVSPGVFEARVAAVNGSREQRLVTVHALTSPVLMDCDVVASDPASMLSPRHFEARGVTWPLGSGQQAPLGPRVGGPIPKEDGGGPSFVPGQSCEAVLLKGNFGADALVFWTHALPMATFDYDAQLPEDWPGSEATVVLRADYGAVDATQMNTWPAPGCDYYRFQGWDCQPSQAPAGARYAWEALPNAPVQVRSWPTEETPGSCEDPGATPRVAWAFAADLDLDEGVVVLEVMENPEHPDCRAYMIAPAAAPEGGRGGLSLCGPARLHRVMEDALLEGVRLRFAATHVAGNQGSMLEIALQAAHPEAPPPLARRLLLVRAYAPPEGFPVRWQGEVSVGAWTPA